QPASNVSWAELTARRLPIANARFELPIFSHKRSNAAAISSQSPVCDSIFSSCQPLSYRLNFVCSMTPSLHMLCRSRSGISVMLPTSAGTIANFAIASDVSVDTATKWTHVLGNGRSCRDLNISVAVACDSGWTPQPVMKTIPKQHAIDVLFAEATVLPPSSNGYDGRLTLWFGEPILLGTG